MKRKYTFSESVRFEPWVGTRYEESGRLLVVGNSHYGIESQYTRHFTTDMVHWYPDLVSRTFFTKIAQALADLPARNVDFHAEFEKIAFYNFAQEFAAERARVPLQSKKLSSWLPALWEVCDMMQPSRLIVLGSQVWHAMPDGSQIKPLSIDGNVRNAHHYSRARSQFWALNIYHPASGFSYIRWAPWVALLRSL